MPIFIIAFIISPWRMIPLFKTFYVVDPKQSLSKQIQGGRNNVVSALKSGLLDYITILCLITLIITIIRIPFLIAILKKNIFYATKKTTFARYDSILLENSIQHKQKFNRKKTKTLNLNENLDVIEKPSVNVHDIIPPNKGNNNYQGIFINFYFLIHYLRKQ